MNIISFRDEFMRRRQTSEYIDRDARLFDIRGERSQDIADNQLWIFTARALRETAEALCAELTEACWSEAREEWED